MLKPDREPIRPQLVWLASAFALGATVLIAAVILFARRGPDDGAGTGGHDETPGPAWRSERAHAAHPRPPSPEGPLWAEEPQRAPGFAPARRNDYDDPQLWAMRRTVGTGADGGVPLPFDPTHRRGRVASVSGNAPVDVGAACEVRVLPVRTHRFNCLVRVICDDVVLYPDGSQHAGYVPCTLQDGVPVRAVDDGYTHADGDPTIRLDLLARQISISDEVPNGPRFDTRVVLSTGDDRRL